MASARGRKLVEGMVGDDSGDNVSELNPNLGELTAHYWVWKNYLPKATEEYIGFGHYRRFLDPKARERIVKCEVNLDDFIPIFDKWREKDFVNCFRNCDIILSPAETVQSTNCLQQYLNAHPGKDLYTALDIIREKYPEYAEFADLFFKGNKAHFYLNFVMRKELLQDYFNWSFGIIDEMRQRLDWTHYTDYKSIRTPAFIIERLFNVWRAYQTQIKGCRVKEVRLWMLDESGNAPPPPKEPGWLKYNWRRLRRALKKKLKGK